MKTLIALVALAGILKYGDAVIQTWTTPVIGTAIGTGTLAIDDIQATATTITTYVATHDQSTVTYALESAVSPFSLDTAGVLTITSTLVGASSSYTLNIVATDDSLATGTAAITVTVTQTATPAFGQSAYTACIITGATAGTTLAVPIATDTDAGQTVTHSIFSGNTNTDFTIAGATGVITVDTGKTLAMATTSTYTLVVYGTDDGATAKTGTTTVSVEVTTAGTCTCGAIAVGVSIMTILMALFVSM